MTIGRWGPFAIGVGMGAIMLAMLHRPIMDGTLSAGDGLVGFILAHVAIVGAIALVALFVPSVRRRVLRHRPSRSHVAGMFLGMIAVATVTHAVIHGGGT